MPTVESLGPLYSQTRPIGLVRLHEHLLLKFPDASLGGMYNPTSKLSGGGPSAHRVTQALDEMCDEDTAYAMQRYIVEELADALNLQQCLTWHKIWTVGRQSEGIRYYEPDDHSGGNGHVHIHVGYDASKYWRPQAGERIEEDFMASMSEEEVALLIRAARLIENNVDPFCAELKSNNPSDDPNRRWVGILPLLRVNVIGLLDEMKTTGGQPWSNLWARLKAKGI